MRYFDKVSCRFGEFFLGLYSYSKPLPIFFACFFNRRINASSNGGCHSRTQGTGLSRNGNQNGHTDNTSQTVCITKGDFLATRARALPRQCAPFFAGNGLLSARSTKRRSLNKPPEKFGGIENPVNRPVIAPFNSCWHRGVRDHSSSRGQPWQFHEGESSPQRRQRVRNDASTISASIFSFIVSSISVLLRSICLTGQARTSLNQA